MANIAVINAVGISSYAFVPLEDGKSAFDRVLDFAHQLPDIRELHIITDSDEVGRVMAEPPQDAVRDLLDQGDWDVPRLFGKLERLSTDVDDIFYFFADCPLLDLGITFRMYESHHKYYSEYTFADGYPLGMSPEILTGEAISRMARLVKESDGRIERDTIFAVIQRDVNGFDIETEIAPIDLRLLRIQLFCNSLRNFQITSRVLREGGRDEESVLAVVQKRQELLRAVPAYYEVQITETMPQVPRYLPHGKLGIAPGTRGREMALDDYRRLSGEIAELSGDAVVSLSLAGEPAAHPQIVEFVGETLRHDGLKVLIETSGIGWGENELQALARFPHDRMTWIVDLDASTKELYESLRGSGWEEAQTACERLIELFPERVHVQATRMHENEADLEAFYRYWKERVSNVIIQKYDWYCGFLPQKKVTDLSPLRRLPCWHLKRDMIILVDGRVPMCREDLEGKHLLGNALTEPLAAVWAKGESNYLNHVREDYPELCKGCDEYYTYNF